MTTEGQLLDVGHQLEAPTRRYAPQDEPPRPLRDAPARFGEAGLSAGEEGRIKTSIPDHPQRTIVPTPEKLAQGLGVFSIALGLAEVLAAGQIAGWLGMKHKSGVIRGYGVREIANGVGLLVAEKPRTRAKLVRARVAGDVVDLATLATGLTPDNKKKENVAAAITAVGMVTLLDLTCAMLLSER